jgi:MtfA peptidase
MIFRWLRERRRRRIVNRPFPPRGREVIARHLAAWAWLDEEERERLEGLVAVFVAEKHWEGCGGLELTEEIEYVIAAHAGLLILNLHHEFYRNVKSILVYPSTVVTSHETRGDSDRGGTSTKRVIPILGEAMQGGPVMLVWDAVRENCIDARKGHNVVYHEFAHKLDMLDGTIDGAPPLVSSESLREWAEVVAENYEDLRERTDRGDRTLLSDYASTNLAEFFAVATEIFFTRPLALSKLRPELYEILAAFFRQDPASRERPG